jgi:ribosomal protein L1
MIDRHIKIHVVTDGKHSAELKEMGFGHAATIEEAISQVQEDHPRADVAAALNAKVLIGISSPQ